jgi:formate dehydrogenase subunit gamma
MTAMPGSVTPTAPDRAFVPRFGTTERALHWIHAGAFFALLGTGLVLYLPSLAAHVGNRPLVKAVHLGVAAGWLTALVVIALAGDRRALRRTRQELERFVEDDVRWLRGRRAPQGRFNAGQKVHAVLQAGLAVLFTVSGTLLWLGERNTALRLSGSIAVHDVAMYLAVVLVAGHLVLALVVPATRPALRGMVRGVVRADWARAHHAAWTPPADAPRARGRRPGRAALAAAAAVLIAGALGTTALVRSVLDGSTARAGDAPSARSASATPAAANAPAVTRALTLAGQAQALDQAGRLDDALALYARATRALPELADLRGAYGFALARAGRLRQGTAELGAAERLDPRNAPIRLELGAVLLRAGHTAAGRAELRRALRLQPHGEGAAAARRLLAGR